MSEYAVTAVVVGAVIGVSAFLGRKKPKKPVKAQPIVRGILVGHASDFGEVYLPHPERGLYLLYGDRKTMAPEMLHIVGELRKFAGRMKRIVVLDAIGDDGTYGSFKAFLPFAYLKPFPVDPLEAGKDSFKAIARVLENPALKSELEGLIGAYEGRMSLADFQSFVKEKVAAGEQARYTPVFLEGMMKSPLFGSANTSLGKYVYVDLSKMQDPSHKHLYALSLLSKVANAKEGPTVFILMGDPLPMNPTTIEVLRSLVKDPIFIQSSIIADDRVLGDMDAILMSPLMPRSSQLIRDMFRGIEVGVNEYAFKHGLDVYSVSLPTVIAPQTSERTYILERDFGTDADMALAILKVIEDNSLSRDGIVKAVKKKGFAEAPDDTIKSMIDKLSQRDFLRAETSFDNKRVAVQFVLTPAGGQALSKSLPEDGEGEEGESGEELLNAEV